ncbi:MAG: hypothetical protein M1818_000564 [Claussenomyces sp. TS43310]|nr:MAG: hypothetical protein M1818_000564 [Claussenomyces sp. TS43310]
MGLFSSTSPSPPAPKISSDGTPIAPDRSQRSKCWEARDAYFSCLDKHDIVDSLSSVNKSKANKECAQESKGFETNCATSWVQYFKKRRVMEYQRNKQLEKLKAEGALELPPGVGPMPPAGPR